MATLLPIATKQFIMDKQLVEWYGEEILSYRLRTARERKRCRRDDFDKRLLALRRQIEALYDQRRKLGWEPLDPPVQKGWKRFFVLRDDVARSKQADLFQQILDKINTTDWSHRKDFLVKKRRFGKKKYVVKGQRLWEPDEYQFAKLGLSEKEQQFFYSVYRTEKYSRLPVKYFVFTEPWRFVLRTRPNMITKVRKRDSQLDAAIQKLRGYIVRNHLERRIEKLKSGSYKYRDEFDRKPKDKYDFKNKSINQILEMITET